MQITKEELSSAEEMIETFVSAGTDYFTIVAERGETFFTRKHNDKEVTLLNLRNDLSTARIEKCNLHIRPYSLQNTLIQLDDCPIKDIFPFRVYGCQQNSEAIFPFLVIETSKNNYQAWLSIRGKLKDEVIKSVKKIYLSDTGATGSCRVVSSFNLKEKHAPNFPKVNLIHSDRDAIIEPDSLLELDFNITQKHEEKKHFRFQPNAPAPNLKVSPYRWPFYDRALKMAPLKRDNSGVDRSKADYIWSWTALSWGHSIEEVVEKLLRVSQKAQEKGEEEAREYAFNTVLSASSNL